MQPSFISFFLVNSRSVYNCYIKILEKKKEGKMTNSSALKSFVRSPVLLWSKHLTIPTNINWLYMVCPEKY